MFCTDDGEPWSKNKTIQASANVLQRAGLAGKYVAYDLRHTYVVTAASKPGASLETVAADLQIAKINGGPSATKG